MQASTHIQGSSQASTQDGKSPMFPSHHRVLFALITVLFFLWGMSNNLTDILVQQFRKSFELTQLSAQLVQTANFLGYFCMAIPAALMMRRWDYKTGMIGHDDLRNGNGPVLAGGDERRVCAVSLRAVHGR